MAANNLPKQICSECMNKLNDVYEFRKQIEESEYFLQNTEVLNKNENHANEQIIDKEYNLNIEYDLSSLNESVVDLVDQTTEAANQNHINQEFQQQQYTVTSIIYVSQ